MTAKREAILTTAKSLFAQSSYHSTGVDKIAAASGASKMTLYSHFTSKEQLIAEVLCRRDEEFVKSLSDAMNQAAPGIARLAAVFEWHQEWFRRADFHGCMFIKASEEFEGQSEMIMDVSRRHKTLILEMIEGCFIEAGIDDPADLGRLLFTLIEGMIVNAQMFGADRGMSIGWPLVESIIEDQLARRS
jgi:AcrR family transcriptional regulator